MNCLSLNNQTCKEALYSTLSRIVLRNPAKDGRLAIPIPEEIIQKIMKDAEFDFCEVYERLVLH